MPRINFNVSINSNEISRFTRDTAKTVKKAVKDCGMDYARTVSETVPHDTGDLEDSYTIAYSGGIAKPTAHIEFAVYKAGFNYAVAMHEWTYNLGEGSRAKSGGTGMSGTHYPVGNKYMTRVIEGESQAYYDYIKRKIMENM